MKGDNMAENKNVNHPSHYAEGRKYEPIDVIEDWELGFNLGNTVKYISRAGRKDNIIQDLEKAAWYLNREIERRKKEEKKKIEKAYDEKRKKDLVEQITKLNEENSQLRNMPLITTDSKGVMYCSYNNIEGKNE